MVDDFRFLRPWTMVLPDRYPCLLAVAGHGAKTSLLRRLESHYRQQSRRVLWARSAPGPLPAGGSAEPATTDPSKLRSRLRERGHAVLDPGPDAGHVTDPADIAECAAACEADVTLVEAQASCGSLLWPDAPSPRWPAGTDLAFRVSNLAALDRLWTAEVVHGAPAQIEDERRVEIDDLLAIYGRGTAPMPVDPETCRCLPFLAGFGSLRSVDAMFDLGRSLWEDLGHQLLCFAELEGDERRDTADRQQVEGTAAAEKFLEGERVYAIYPAGLDRGEEGDSSIP